MTATPLAARTHVVCRNMACPAPADTWITLTVVAPGVVAYPLERL